ncbi:MAG: hypothetical protein K2X98_01945 [Alphaproteobacteria bacterium]|nr:hypothetical protein [Alphaproteobacteria bacterium]
MSYSFKILVCFLILLSSLKAPLASNKVSDRGILHHFVDESFQRVKFLVRFDEEAGSIMPRELGQYIGALIFQKNLLDHNETVDKWATTEVEEWTKDPWRDLSQSPLVKHLWECFDNRPLQALLARELCKRIIFLDPKELTGSTFKREIVLREDSVAIHPWQPTSSFNGFFEESETQRNLGYHEGYYDNESETQPILHFMMDNDMDLFDYVVQQIQKPEVRAVWPDHFDPLRDALFHAVIASKPHFVEKLRQHDVGINEFCQMFACMQNNEAIMKLLNG